LLDINQNDIKICGKLVKLKTNIFEFFLTKNKKSKIKKLGWIWPNHPGAGLTRPIYYGLG